MIETALRAAQDTRFAPRPNAGIHAIAPVELFDRLAQCAQLGQLLAVLLQLAHRIGHVAQEIGRQRRQCFGQRIGQTVFVGPLG